MERKEKRINSSRNIDVLGVDSSDYTAISINYSKCGVGIITNLDLSPGDSLKVSCDRLWPEPMDAIVIWVNPISPTHKKTGLSLCVQ